MDSESAGRDPTAPAAWLLAATPGVFVVLWSTGFIIAKLALPHSPPLTFLLMRFVLVLAVLLPLALAFRAPWPRGLRQNAHLAVAGSLLHGAYLAGVFCAIAHGMSAGLTALIVGTQPILTGLAGKLIAERVTARQWLGLLLGFAGVALVLAGRTSAAGVNVPSVSLAVVGLAGITAGTLYQKHYCGAMDLRTGSIVQFIAAFVVLLPFAWLTETPDVRWTGELVFALAWSVVIMSLGAISLLYLLIRRGAATNVSSLFYLVPPTTAVMAYFIFGESLAPLALLGLVMTVGGVAMVVRK
jgi:drug/metabolite transporter (DMT)-like permease